MTRGILEAVASTLIPAEGGLPGGGPGSDIPEKVRLRIQRHPWWLRLGYTALLLVVDLSPIFTLGRPWRFQDLKPEDRLRALQRLSKSRFATIRALIKLLGFLVYPSYYAQPKILDAIGSTVHRHDASNRQDPGATSARELSTSRLEVDVVVVGSGAGGAPLAARLAELGHAVLLLEEGPVRRAEQFPKNATDAIEDLYRDRGMTVSMGSPPVVMPLGRVVGGTTLINSGTCFRVPSHVLSRWKEGGHGDFATELDPWYQQAEDDLGVAPVELAVLGGNNEVAKRGAEAMGWSNGPLRRNAPHCEGSNRCAFGCPTDAKRSMNVSYIPRAVKAGAKVLADARVRRILWKGKGASGVEVDVLSEKGSVQGRFSVSARQVVVACGTVHTPLLLRRSGFRHRALGRNLTLHPAIKVSALFDEPLHDRPGVPQSWYVDEFHDRGIMFEGAHVPPDIAALALPYLGAAHKDVQSHFMHLATYGFMISDNPSGRVHRLPGNIPFIRYSLSREDLERAIFGLERLVELYRAAGAGDIFLPLWKLPVLKKDEPISAIRDCKPRGADFELAAFHPLGTCHFGEDGANSPLDLELRVRGREGLWVCDGSIFPSSLSVNPQMSIMAFSLRLAETLHREL